jgi:hypothetical protein
MYIAFAQILGDSSNIRFRDPRMMGWNMSQIDLGRFGPKVNRRTQSIVRMLGHADQLKLQLPERIQRAVNPP